MSSGTRFIYSADNTNAFYSYIDTTWQTNCPVESCSVEDLNGYAITWITVSGIYHEIAVDTNQPTATTYSVIVRCLVGGTHSFTSSAITTWIHHTNCDRL